jgi:hypothetical protein
VRGKRNPAHDPKLMEQHADCILSHGAPVGFFGADQPASGGSASGYWNSIGVNMKGMVADYSVYQRIRPAYVDLLLAKQAGVISTVLVVKVSEKEAHLFAEYWHKLGKHPDYFSLLGNNCSTHASEAFIHAGVVSRGIPGLDTPNNLYKQLHHLKGRHMRSYSGFLGFLPAHGRGYRVVMAAA